MSPTQQMSEKERERHRGRVEERESEIELKRGKVISSIIPFESPQQESETRVADQQTQALFYLQEPPLQQACLPLQTTKTTKQHARLTSVTDAAMLWRSALKGTKTITQLLTVK